MPYRQPDPDRMRELARESVAGIAEEIGRVDRLIGEWAMRLPEGTPAPPPVLALMAEKEALVTKLHAMVGPNDPLAPPGASALRTFFGWLTGRRAT